VIFPTRGAAAIDARTELRKRSLFQVPVFTANLDMKGSFDLAGAPARLPAGAVADWTRAELLVGVSDPRFGHADGWRLRAGEAHDLRAVEHDLVGARRKRDQHAEDKRPQRRFPEMRCV